SAVMVTSFSFLSNSSTPAEVPRKSKRWAISLCACMMALCISLRSTSLTISKEWSLAMGDSVFRGGTLVFAVRLIEPEESQHDSRQRRRGENPDDGQKQGRQPVS